ncbi:unnamed protein product [Rotaria sp. Silwood2]|nr:unnamed protein product [Rotaria sp. Silwood2]CAF4414784.1 unnamed protein product [Rotaria sp. Silwood2]
MFDPKRLTTKVATLSGGEASRLLLAKTLINPGNLLILDEPTNDLDMDSLEILLDILGEYSSTLLIISHDRDFLHRLVTRTLIFSNNEIIDIAGSYEDYRQLALPGLTPKPPVKLANKPPLPTLIQEARKPQKLSYKYQRLLETIPLEIESLELKIKNLELILSDSALFSANPIKFNQSSNDLVAHKKRLEELLMQWLEIEGSN